MEVSNINWEDFFQAINHPALILDSSHFILAANKSFHKYIGLSEDEIIGRQCFKLIHSSDSKEAPFCCPLDNLTKKGMTESVEMEMEAFGGHALVSCTPIFDENGDLDKIIHIATDITQRKKSEESLKESEEKYRAMMDFSSDAVMLADLEGNLIECNKKSEELIGYSKNEILKLNINDIHPLEELEKIQKAFKNISKRNVAVFDTLVLTKDNKKVPVDITASLVEYGDKQIIQGIFRDITEHKIAEDLLKKVMDVAPYGAHHYVLNSDGQLIFTGANKSADLILKVDNSQFIGKTIEEAFPNLKGTDILEAYKKVASIGETYETNQVEYDGEKIVGIFEVHAINTGEDKMTVFFRDVTETKKAENKLKSSLKEKQKLLQQHEKSESRYRAIFENSGTAILNFKDDGTIIMVNSEWESLSGYSREEVEGKMKWMELVHPDYIEKMMEYHQKRMIDQKSAPHGYETVFIKKSGDLLVMYVTVTAIPGTDKWLASAIDITDLKKTQKALEKNVLRFRALAEYAVDGIITTDSQGKILYFNDSLLNMFGYTQDELQNSKLTKLMPERFRKNFMKTLKKFRFTGEHSLVGRTIETTGLKNNGNEFPFEMSLTKWETNEKIYFTSIIRDITERKKSEKALKESEAYYRTIFDYSGAATVIIEDDTTISLANPEFEKLSGYSVDEIEGKIKWTKFIFEDDLEKMENYHRQRRINPEVVPENYEFRFFNRYGELKDIMLFVALIPGTKKSVASLLDTTKQKKANDYLKWELKVNEALNKIYPQLVSSKSTIDEIANLILNQSLKLTDSKSGLIGEIKPISKEIIILSVIPSMPLKGPQKPILKLDKDNIYGGLMGHSLNIKRGFFTNDAVSYPSYSKVDGHFKIEKFLSVPVMLKNEIMGQISIANSSRDYTEHDLDAIKRLSNFYSLALQKIRDREEIKSSLKEKEILLKEVHHRVKNNMQIISSLLNLQIQFEDIDETVDVLKESQGRVKSMALVHEKLYQSDSFSKINFKEYIKNLVSDIFNSYGIKGKIGLELDIDDLNIGIDTAVPLGLIINELVTNSAKYAFPQGKKGIIKILFKLVDDKYFLTISDDGVGIPHDIELGKTKTLGLQLVINLINQIDGNIEIGRNHGTEFKIIFSELEYKDRI
ncbi:MAG: PAS domain S-box protein [Methanobacterium sp.]|uniref:PAS domain S-box protein n=1 Tax=Methanobacterium sp. TaxID=2164 RepID=UPI003D65BE28|nr:PAS domain S-box protein [Methanobacterium sp.]